MNRNVLIHLGLIHVIAVMVLCLIMTNVAVSVSVKMQHCKFELLKNNASPFSVLGSSLCPEINVCDDENGLCTLVGIVQTCDCLRGYELASDQSTCEGISHTTIQYFNIHVCTYTALYLPAAHRY